MDFRVSLKEHIAVVLGSAKTDQELDSVVPNVASQVVQDISKALKNQDYAELTDEAAQLIISQINDLRHSDNRVRLIIRKLLDYSCFLDCQKVFGKKLVHFWSKFPGTKIIS